MSFLFSSGILAERGVSTIPGETTFIRRGDNSTASARPRPSIALLIGARTEAPGSGPANLGG